MCPQINDSYKPLGNTGARYAERKQTKLALEYISIEDDLINSYLLLLSLFPESRKHAARSRETNPQAAKCINFGISTKKRERPLFFLDWRANQKPSPRAGIVIITIKNSPELIRGRLEPHRGGHLL